MDERPFVGGNVSDAVRIGDTVHRRAGPHTPAVHALLAFLAANDFEAPRPLGLDERGREVLTYVAGDTEVGWPDPQPDWVFSDECLRSAARLLRRCHDLTARFTAPASVHWRVVAPTPHEVICHNDWAPHNTVYRDRRAAVMLDWDMAGPGSRAWDVGRAAYSWVPLIPNSPRFTLPERAARLAEFCAAYGDIGPREAMTTLIEALPFYATFIAERHAAGDPAFAKLGGWNVPDRLRREAVILQEQSAALTQAR